MNFSAKYTLVAYPSYAYKEEISSVYGAAKQLAHDAHGMEFSPGIFIFQNGEGKPSRLVDHLKRHLVPFCAVEFDSPEQCELHHEDLEAVRSIGLLEATKGQ